ncbi:phage portal protein [Fulvimarina sp. 2208YS6-2-32]|uniref:Phage portal protein n=1 Tax=Fulvimarina uroteuthidis TaxID=3098149 RepID=A0ABU5I8F0_9HYPH|nr:phage portal protein [Fulvimarina sp. 2208YS6-2-32]MDY8111174.1 phage portal protein [Fulvimarina sp. 2208YS6-2-32]
MSFDRLKHLVEKAFGAPEQKAAPTFPYDTFGLDAFLSPATISNVAVTPQTAMRVPAVAAAVNRIAQSIGSIPARIVRTVDGSTVAATDHPAYRLVAKAPNDRVTAGKLRERLAYDALLHGNAFAFANRVGGRVIEIVRLDPHAVSIQIDTTTGEAIYRSTTDKNRILDPRDLIHIQAPVSFDGVTGVSPIVLAREAIALAITMEARAAKLFGTSARPAGVIQAPTGLGQTEIDRAKTNWKASNEGVENGGKTPFLSDGMTFNPLTFSSVDAQFLEMRREQTVEIARAFGVPATMLFELSKGGLNNVEHQSREFVNFTLAPWVSTFTGEFERALLSEDERDEYAVEFDTDALLAVDTATRVDRIHKLRAAGVLTANDVRREEGYPALPDGDVLGSPFTTSNSNDTTTPASSDSETVA